MTQAQNVYNEPREENGETDHLMGGEETLNTTTSDDDDSEDDEEYDFDLNESEEFEVGYGPRMRLVQFEKNTTEPMVRQSWEILEARA